jgi:hypothetical protein
MSTTPLVPSARSTASTPSWVSPAIAALAVTQLATAAWMLLAPRSFFDNVGPFGAYNVHYIRDAMALTGGLGVGLAASLRWPALRPGAVAVNAAATGFHAVNHWFDVGDAHPGSDAGWLDAVALTIGTVAYLVLLRATLPQEPAVEET